jgi:hypothetical protein
MKRSFASLVSIGVSCCSKLPATALILLSLARPVAAQQNRKTEAPYPPSPVIKNLTIHAERSSIGDGDNWPITWADDGNLYTVYCDGKGFGGGSGPGSMSLAKIAGTPPDITGENIASATAHKTGGGHGGRKASGLLMVDGNFYMWVRNLNKNGTGSSLAWSKDHAKTWTWANWSFPEIGYPVWMNAGQNYEAAQDDYVYMYSPDSSSAYKTTDHIFLARVHKSQIPQKEGYHFFAGLDAGKPQWSPRFEDRKPVFTAPARCYRPEVVYNPGFKRYLLCTATSGSREWCGTDKKYLGIFDAPTPWGPWTTVKEIPGWGGEEEDGFQQRIPMKWISDKGRSFFLLYSCFPKGPYKFNVQRCTIETLDGR